jgi:hypothetical protein
MTRSSRLMSQDSSQATTDAAISHPICRWAAWNRFSRAIAATTAPMTSRVEPTLNLTCSTLAGCSGGLSPVTAVIVDRWP